MVVPNVMGSALRLHPLLVIFGLLAGGEVYGLPGVFVALPLLAAIRAIWEFFSDRIALEPWAGAGPVPVEVEIEQPPTGPASAPAPVAPVERAEPPHVPPAVIALHIQYTPPQRPVKRGSRFSMNERTPSSRSAEG